jgi:flagellar L-ring protein precursor FlgH
MEYQDMADKKPKSYLRRTAALAAATLLLGACNVVDRVTGIGGEPQMSQIQNPVQTRKYKPVTLPMPRERHALHEPNSL